MARNIGQEKISTTQILKFLHQTMNTWNAYKNQFKGQTDTKLTLSEI